MEYIIYIYILSVLTLLKISILHKIVTRALCICNKAPKTFIMRKRNKNISATDRKERMLEYLQNGVTLKHM